MKDKGTSHEIVRMADYLHTRTMELQESTITCKDICSVEITFASADLKDLLTVDGSNIVGKVAVGE